MMTSSLVKFILLFLFSLHGRVAGKPYSLIVSSKESCFLADFPPGMKFLIEYEAPADVILNGEHPFEKEVKHHDRDPRLNRKQANGALAADMVMTVHLYHAEHPDLYTPPIYTHTVQSPIGNFEFMKEEEHHQEEVLICTQSLMASRTSPRRIHVKVREYFATYVDKEVDQTNVEEHLTRLEFAIKTLTQEIDNVVLMAEHTKEEEQDFHKQSIDMNAAAKWWPIVQVMVLLGTGFTQANYMVQFFKARHII